jgi:pre-rRNA-processing protein IPI3
MEDIVISTSSKTDGTTTDDPLSYAWDLNTGTVLSTFKTAGCDQHAMDVIMYDKDKKQSMMALIHGHMIHTYILGKSTVWGKYVAPPIDTVKTGSAEDKAKMSGHRLTAMKLSPSMKWLYAGSSNGKLFIWQLSSGNLLKYLDAHYRKINRLLCIQDDYIITAGDDSFIHIWFLAE